MVAAPQRQPGHRPENPEVVEPGDCCRSLPGGKELVALGANRWDGGEGTEGGDEHRPGEGKRVVQPVETQSTGYRQQEPDDGAERASPPRRLSGRR